MNKRAEIFANKLLSWYKKNALRFPWRETSDPYKILLAEILLRKTTREQVKGIFDELVAKYPNLKKLASADISKLEKNIESLGMQKMRARLLIKLAKDIIKIHSGKVPRDRENLMKLHGVGAYSANAVLCLAYNEQLSIVDTNVIRIVERFFKIKSGKPRPRTDHEIWSFVEGLIPDGKARKFNLAMLDFANLVCTPKSPKCRTCPLKDICLYPNKIKVI